MSFECHRSNLIEWIDLGSVLTGREADSRILLLAEEPLKRDFLDGLKERVLDVTEEPSGEFDHIIIPLLTEKTMSLIRDGQIMEKLKKGGSIFIGTENSLDIDYLSNDPEEKFKRLTIEETEKLGEELSLSSDYRYEIYFPYPDLLCPFEIFNERGIVFAALEKRHRSLGKLFRKFAPSFFLIISKKGKISDYREEYIKFNSSRKDEYALKTEILRTGELLGNEPSGDLIAVKKALNVKANPHIESFDRNTLLFQEDFTGEAVFSVSPEGIKDRLPKNLLLNERGLSYRIYPFIKGETLSEHLRDSVKDGLPDGEMLKYYLSVLPGDKYINNDCLFENAMLDGDTVKLYDFEWIEYGGDRKFAQYRILYYWYLSSKELLKISLEEFLKEYFSEEEIRFYREKEKEFQESIHGKKDNINTFRDGRINYRLYKSLKDEIEGYKYLNSELESKLADREMEVKRSRETERLTSVHAGNLENVIRIHERDIKNLLEERDFYRKRQGLIYRFREGIDRRIDRVFPKGSRKRKLVSYIMRPQKTLPLLMTERGRNLIDGDFNIGSIYTETGKLFFRTPSDPVVSLVIPVFNQIGYTYQCLRSVLKFTDMEKIPTEVIIADDVSEDATKELDKYTEGLIISRNKENQGFLKNCNQAAEKARGKYLFFLNNDTEVTENWLSSLLELMENDETIGLAGSKLVYPDGKLQEAGGIIWSDGSGWNYGRGQDPDLPEFNYVRETDFISGAAIMIKRTLFNELGGFSEYLCPAYYEDVDLAFKVREKGLKVMYQPFSKVIHYEGISNGTDVNGTGLKRYQLVNRDRFREKWKEELKKQFVNTGNPDPFKARERGRDKKYLLFIEHYVPTFDKDAGSKLDLQYIRLFLKKGFSVKLLGDNFRNEEPYTSYFQKMGVEVLYGPLLQSGIWDYLEKNRDNFDIAYLNRPHIAAKYIDFLREKTNMKIIFFGCDLHSLRLKREYLVTGNEETEKEARYWGEMEYQVMRKADMSYYPSEAEIEVIHKADRDIKVKAITAFIYENHLEVPEDFEKREGILFVGGFAHPPNKDAVLYFINDILPIVRRSLPDVKFRIAGSGAPEEILALNGKNGVEVLGFVSDERLSELYRETRIVAAPLRFGAGIKGKIVDAMHEGSAIITTSVGAEGIKDKEKALVICDSAEDFAGNLIRIYSSPSTLREMSRNAREIIDSFYTEDGAWEIIREDFE